MSTFQMQYGERYDRFTHLYNIGDVVFIRKKEEIPMSWDWDEDAMSKYCGKAAKVTERHVEDATNIHYYSLDIDGGKYWWTNQMLDSVWNKMQSAPDKKEDGEFPYPKLDEGDLVWHFCNFIQEADLGPINGNFKCVIDKENVQIRADLEGNRSVAFQIKKGE